MLYPCALLSNSALVRALANDIIFLTLLLRLVEGLLHQSTKSLIGKKD
jgi:hypothetical protein